MLPPGFDAGNFLIHHLNEYSPSHITRSGASPKTLKGTTKYCNSLREKTQETVEGTNSIRRDDDTAPSVTH